MYNFDYLRTHRALKDLYTYCQAAELNQLCQPDVSALNGRRALEWVARAIYQMKGIEIDTPYRRASLFELVNGEPFTEFLCDDELMRGVHYLRKVGNRAAHEGKVTRRESFFALLNLYRLVAAVMLRLRVVEEVADFDQTLIPQQAPIHVHPQAEPEPSKAFVTSAARCKPLPREEVAVPAATDLTEAETRRCYIDLMLREAGWEVVEEKGKIVAGKACVELPLEGLRTTPSGRGFADYVLMDHDGRALAVIEAKRTSLTASEGEEQVADYADALERKYGIRPVTYCTNGFTTLLTDDGLGYPPRQVYGFHSIDDLQRLLLRRQRQSLDHLQVNAHITDRSYQYRAIHHVCERFTKLRRRTLLVMATGTGKTRVAISLTDVLQRLGWVKTILFLADRTSLVRQAARSFEKLLPHTPAAVLNEDHQPDKNARILLSTYQTMINYIDNETKEFSIGRFDLIIVDEAHRSVFGKYTALFDYFDGFLVGLTATPRDEVERNTFELFESEAESTFAYELEEAVANGYLCPHKAFRCGTHLLERGIRYQDLTEEQRNELEGVWGEGEPRDIESHELLSYIFNRDTVDKVICHLMEHGQRVDEGERIGKSIIFATNHEHAQLIVDRFHYLYPEYGGEYCMLIDNTVNRAQTRIDRFADPGSKCQIAVSVDMLDTGIDVPEVLNLVFFKQVHSKIKFMQMIGRGTRLAPNVFGEGADKEYFNIFDWGNNFDFFGVNPNGVETSPKVTLSTALFAARTELAYLLQSGDWQQTEAGSALHDALKQSLHADVAGLNGSRIDVRRQWAEVEHFRLKENWMNLGKADVQTIREVIAPLITNDTDEVDARQLDYDLVNVELALGYPQYNAQRSRKAVMRKATLLVEKKANIPMVKEKLPLLREVMNPDFWKHAGLADLERVRLELRSIMKFAKREHREYRFINILDQVTKVGEPIDAPLPQVSYQQRVIDYLKQHSDHEVFRKIRHLEPLSEADITSLERILWCELGTKEEYERCVAEKQRICGDRVAAFIRSQVGVDREVALRRYAQFLNDHDMSEAQQELLESIITYVSKNGDITPQTLMSVPPFNDTGRLLSVFGDDLTCLTDYINELHRVIC